MKLYGLMAICKMPKLENFEKLSEHDFEYLNSQQSLRWKILEMKKMLSLTKEEIYERERIVADFIELLRVYYPECVLIVYGSSANGFGFKGCDLDLLFLPFPGYCNLDFVGKGSGIRPSPYHVLSGKYSRKDLLCMEEENHLKFAQSVMYTKKHYFKKIFYVPAKCPILNIEFVGSTIVCDFSSSNRLVEHNTDLLWVFGQLDYCVRPLVMFLRYWAKSLGFIAKSLLSSYCFTLMVIFYLQNSQPSILPSVKCLNELAGYSRVIDGWETAIRTDPEYINSYRHENKTLIEDLLLEFFEFYWQFDFTQNIVSPHLGRALSVKEVKESNDERVKDFQVTPFSVQDPFILSRNISRNATMKTSFKLALLIAKKLLLKKNFSLHLLFDSSYYQEQINAMFAPTINNLSTASVFFSLQLCYNLCCKLKTATQSHSWFETACQTVLDVMKHGLLIECEVVDKILWRDETSPRPAKRKRVNADSPGILKLIMSIQCVVNFPTLWNRKKINLPEKIEEDELLFSTELDVPAHLRNEYMISEVLKNGVLKPNNIESQSPFFRFMCHLYHFSDMQVTDIVVIFSPLTDVEVFNDAKCVLKSFVQKHTKKILETN